MIATCVAFLLITINAMFQKLPTTIRRQRQTIPKKAKGNVIEGFSVYKKLSPLVQK